MVENNEAFCLPHNLSYDGSYHARHYYPRLICCRYSSTAAGMTSPGDGGGGGGSPADSPHRKPLLAHVEGAAVVSKIARPPGHAPLTCSPPSPASPPAEGVGLRGPDEPRTGGGGGGGVGVGGGGAGGGVVVRQPGPCGSLFSGRADRGLRDGGSADQVAPAGVGSGSAAHTTHSLTPQKDLEQYLVAVTTGSHLAGVLMGDGNEAAGGDAAPDPALSPASPDSTTTTTTSQRPVFRLSDASDFSDDYTAMTDTGTGKPQRHLDEDAGVNGSSVCSDVFSDRSSDAGGTLESDVTDAPLFPNDVTSLEDLEEDDDDVTPRVFAGLTLETDSPAKKTLLLASTAMGGQGQGEGHLDDLADPCEEEPGLMSPEITLEEVFDLQKDKLDPDDHNGGFYEDREFDFLKTQPVKRSTSLKTYKTPPGTPKRKMVRFADALGLDLESVRHILNLEAPPRVPKSAMRDLKLESEGGGPGGYKATPTQGARYLTACFAQPGINPTFPLMVRDRKVILESCVINDHNLSVSGTVRVANLHFHKDVTVRYSTNNWLTFNDINGGYVHNSTDGPTDRFSFTISLPHYFSTGSRLEFCIRYVTGGEAFWDNNHGRNYLIECYARALPDSDNTWMSFL